MSYMPLALPGTQSNTARRTAHPSRRRRFLVYFFVIHRCASSVGASTGSESALLQCPWESTALHAADVVVVQEESLVWQVNGSELGQSTAPCILRMESRRLGAAAAAPRTAADA